MDDSRLASIRELAEPILNEMRLELVELTARPQSRVLAIRMLVDAVGGVTVQQCGKANQQIRQALEEAHLVEEDCELEVSSPGLNRPLVSIRDFERAIGENIHVDYVDADGKNREFRGMVLAVQPEAVVLKTKSGNFTVARAQIRTAKKVLPW